MNAKIFATVAFIFLLTLAAYGQIPQLINYQGVLTDTGGEPIKGNHSITFSIYNAETGGDAMWSEIQTVEVDKGLFHILLGSVTPIPFTLFDGTDKYLGIKVDSDTEMIPRKCLVSVAYSFRSYDAYKLDGKQAADFVVKNQENSVSTNMIQSNAVTNEKILPNIVSSINNVSNDGGNINLVQGDNITIKPDDENNQITISSSGMGNGDITAVNAGNGLTDGGISGDVTLNVGAGEGISVALDQVSLNTTFTDGRYINVNESNSINNNMIQNNSVTLDKVSPNIVSSIDGVSNDGGNIALIAGSNIEITPDNSNKKITISATGIGTGDITAVNAGNGLTGGGNTGDVTLNVGAGNGIAINADQVSLNTSFTDGLYVNESQSNSVTSAMITDGTITNNDISNTAAINPSKISGTAWTTSNDGAGSGLDADLLDGQHASSFLSTNNDYGRSGVTNDLFEGTTRLNDKYVNEGQTNSISNSMIQSNAVTIDKISPNVVSSIEGVTNDGGNIDLIPGSNITISADDANNSITISATGSIGDVTAVYAGDGLTGGGTSGDVTVHIGAGNGISVSSDQVALNTIYTDGRYVNEGQTGSVTSDMISNGTITNNDISNSAAISPSKIGGTAWTSTNDGSGSGLDADLIDGQNASSFLSTSNDYGRSGVASNLYEGIQTLTDRYVNEGQSNSITSNMITDGTITNSDISSSAAISPSKISGTAWTSSNDGSGSGLDADLIDGQHASSFLSTSNDYGRSGVASTLYEGTQSLTDRYVNEGQSNSITSSMIVNGTITGSDILSSTDINSRNLTASNNINAYNVIADAVVGSDVIYTAVPSSNFGSGDIAATDDIFADDGVYCVRVDARGSNAMTIFGQSSVTNGIGVYGYCESGKGVLGQSAANYSYGVYGISPTGYAVYGYSTNLYAGYFNGNVAVTNMLSKGGGSFRIDHPLDPENKYLNHSFVESLDMMNIYNGNVTLDTNGEAWVELPMWFEALNRDFRYQLTCIGDFAQVYIAEEISNNRFKISGGKSNLKVSWQVTGIRQDAFANAHRIQVEEIKPKEERGKYLHPREYGVSETLGIHYEEMKAMGDLQKFENERDIRDK